MAGHDAGGPGARSRQGQGGAYQQQPPAPGGDDAIRAARAQGMKYRELEARLSFEDLP